jgi:hypothetical protein
MRMLAETRVTPKAIVRALRQIRTCNRQTTEVPISRLTARLVGDERHANRRRQSDSENSAHLVGVRLHVVGWLQAFIRH